jgi:lipid-A-disaccharide synthase
MGLVEVLGRLPELLSIRRQLIDSLLAEPPDIYVGIDAPDFNLPIEARLKSRGIKTVHYVSPSVWAWRQGRVKKIRAAVDLMLTLLPFEAEFYQRHDVPVRFVGHPLAYRIGFTVDPVLSRQLWGHHAADRIVAVLPGSRGGELQCIGPIFAQTMQRISQLDPRVRFMAPMATPQRRLQFEKILAGLDVSLDVELIDGHAREVMAAADVVLVASGTATLEAMLLKRPMVVAYKWGNLTHAIISRMVRVQHVALPNLLAGHTLVPEYLQSAAQPAALAKAVLDRLDDPMGNLHLKQQFDELHHELRRDADQEAADALLALLEYRLD